MGVTLGVTSFLLLGCVGLAIVEAQDCPRPTPGPNMSLKDSDILLQTFPDGTSVSFVCDPGYVSGGGSPTITCGAGKWTPIFLRCNKRNCGSAGEVANGMIDYSEGTEFGAKIYITCNTGYTLVGNSEITCGVQGWMSRLPVCEVVVCEPPPQIAGGTFTPVEETYEYGGAVQYSCERDYTLVGPQSISCSENGTFHPAPPRCLKVQCAEPVIPNAEWISGSRPPYGYKATVTYRCLVGYTMTGTGTLSCGQDNQWTPEFPKCTRTTTKAPTTTTTTTTTKGTTKMTTTTKPPPTTKTPKSPTTPTTTSDGITTGQGIGIAFGVLAFLAIFIGGIYYGCIKKGSRRDHDKVATAEALQL